MTELPFQFQSLAKQKCLPFFFLSLVLTLKKKKKRSPPRYQDSRSKSESDVARRYVGCIINLQEIRKSAVSHVLSRPKPRVYSRETSSPPNSDDGCRWKENKVIYSTSVTKFMYIYFSRHRNRSQCHATQTRITVNTTSFRKYVNLLV